DREGNQERDPVPADGLRQARERLWIDDAQRGVDRMRELAETRRERLWIAAHVNGEPERRHLARQRRPEDAGSAEVAGIVRHAEVGYDADDLVPRLGSRLGCR